jgi:hypothetical protein
MFFQANTNYDLFEPSKTRGEICFSNFFGFAKSKKMVFLLKAYICQH